MLVASDISKRSNTHLVIGIDIKLDLCDEKHEASSVSAAHAEASRGPDRSPHLLASQCLRIHVSELASRA